MDSNQQIGWYALRIFHNKTSQVCDMADKHSVEWYTPIREVETVVNGRHMLRREKLMPSLLFLRSTTQFIEEIRRATGDNIRPYCSPGTTCPRAIGDTEMEVFMFVARTASREIELLDEKSIADNSRVRITGGIFAGMEGYITRVHGTKRFVVRIEGVTAIATTYIPKEHIQRIL